MSADTVLRITDEEYKAIMTQTGRTKEEMDQSMQSLRDWLKKEPHLPDTEEDDLLFAMLMFSKWSVERAKQKVDACYTCQSISPELFIDNEPLLPSMQQTIEKNVMMPLPRLGEDYSRVYFMKTFTDTSEFNFVDCIRYLMCTMTVILKYDNTFQSRVLIDFNGFSFGHLQHIVPSILIKNITFFSSVFPNNIKGFHFVNVPSFTQNLIKLIKSTMKNKMAERVHIHKDMESLHKFIARQVLPAEYGGTEEPLLEMYGLWRQFMESQNDWIKGRMNCKSDESLRIGTMYHSDIYGPQGSFRQLNVD